MICTLGNFSTKLLRDDPTGISRLHGRDEIRTIGSRAVRLLPLFHPAAALYTPSNLQTLRDDFARIPELLALEPPPQPSPPIADLAPAPDQPPDRPEPEPESERPAERDQPSEQTQLGLF